MDLRARLDTDEKSFASPWERTVVVQSVVRHYTDWATPPGSFILVKQTKFAACNYVIKNGILKAIIHNIFNEYDPYVASQAYQSYQM
jgi:hypothetical protein